MSNDPNSQNPFTDENPYAVTAPPNLSDSARGMVGHVQTLGILMVIHGVLVAIWGGFMGAMGVVMPVFMAEIQEDPEMQDAPFTPEQLEQFLFFFYIGMGILLVAIGILGIFAGIRVFQFRSRTLAIVALSFGFGTLFGGCYCLPTAIALFVYGLLVLLNEPVRAAFELASQGSTSTEIREHFEGMR